MPSNAQQDFLQYINDNAGPFIERLKEAVAIRSISGDTNPDVRKEVIRMSIWMLEKLHSYGVTAEAIPLGKQIINGEATDLDLPPVIVGRIGEDAAKKTVLVYGHLDVQPANQDGWTIPDPFDLDVDTKSGKMIGRGATDDKGPVLGWINVLEAHYKLGLQLPVNMRFCFEAMEESGSEGLDDFIKVEAAKGPNGYFGNVDCVCISDNYWLNNRTPAITYGLRGIAYFNATVSGPRVDLHSGVYGGTVHEPMTDLIAIMSRLVDSQGQILFDGAYENVPSVTDEEVALYEAIDFDVSELEEFTGPVALSQDKITVLMGRMRNPSLSLHGIVGDSSGPEAQTIIPAKVTGKFSLRLVPPQTPESINAKVTKFLNEQFDTLGTRNHLDVQMVSSGLPWVENTKHWNYDAAISAIKAAYPDRKDPDLIREGGSIPVTLTFAENLPGANIVLIPMGRGDDGAHSANEKLDIENFITGSQLLGMYLYAVAAAETN
ncbi:hypothetical protein NLI96_g290 [Meripilus lineatus]|uniref:Peptidase M20 dimerisation domain-containing protein n=1 Tax=Meripilus lineatus TaxID=2056292 RepID=A0AAD5VI72_9APHY|nr:hypothetical protein NLI96_g290 [Physisporinus lineatus]